MQQVKQPAEKLLLEFDFAGRLGTAAAVVGVTSSPAGLTFTGTTISEGRLQTIANGGTAGTTYVVTAQASANGGALAAEIDADLVVVDLGATLPGTVASTYLSGAAYVARFGLEETVQLTDQNGTGTIDAARLNAALSDAAEVVDAYLRARYAIPLAPVPGLVAQIVGDLARERLHNDSPTAAVQNRGDQARRMLADIAKGTITLESGVAEAPAWDGATAPAYTAPARVFTGAGLP